ncbi:prephenate dehydratase [Paramicrobacterium agarici]|uniref:Prephenate dehydratase n=1 Tax=Paramicrobacterium agarici TaxID=630514 RepID=A0A2A9DTK2_9MICO|nr:prephenate dehydratase [Microbacterium agarici]PFG29302.1 prephenate dehydratase [Microbacterium agarici]
MPQNDAQTLRTYSYLGPRGTFTEAALAQVAEAQGQNWRSVNNVGEAFSDVANGVADGAVVALENSIDGGVSAAQDALATTPGLRIMGEYLVPVDFTVVARRGTTLDQVTHLNGHPVAYAQCRRWIEKNLPGHTHIPSTSNVAAAANLLESDVADAAIAPPTITEHYDLEVLAEHIGDNLNAVTRFVLVTTSRSIPDPTGADKTSFVAELPVDQPGALLDMLEQLSTRGVNMTMIQSRPIGDELGRYRFVIDVDGHVRDERVADALMGIHRFSPRVTFLGSYPRADKTPVRFDARYDDDVYIEARDWLRGLISGEPDAAY